VRLFTDFALGGLNGVKDNKIEFFHKLGQWRNKGGQPRYWPRARVKNGKGRHTQFTGAQIFDLALDDENPGYARLPGIRPHLIQISWLNFHDIINFQQNAWYKLKFSIHYNPTIFLQISIKHFLTSLNFSIRTFIRVKFLHDIQESLLSKKIKL